MAEITWFTEDEIKGSIEKFLAKFDDNQNVDGAEDHFLFYKAMGEAMALSAASDDEDKQEYAEIIDDDIEEYGSLAYFIEVRGHPDKKLVMLLTPDEKKIGKYTGEFEPIPEAQQNVFMEWTPACGKKFMIGQTNTDAEFFAGDLTVKGPLKLATKPRGWIEAFFEFIDREID